MERTRPGPRSDLAGGAPRARTPWACAHALGVAGRAPEGLEIARTLLVAEPLNADLLSADGILAAQTGDLDAAASR